MELIGYLLLTVNLLSPIIFIYFYQKLQNRISELEFENKQVKKRIYDLEDGFSNLSNIVLKGQSIYWTQTPEQKDSQRRSFVYGTTKLANPEITEELVNEIADSQKNSQKTLFDDLWKIEPPVKKICTP